MLDILEAQGNSSGQVQRPIYKGADDGIAKWGKKMRLDFNWERIFLSRTHYSVDWVFKNQKRVEDSFHVTAKRITLLAPRRQNSPWF